MRILVVEDEKKIASFLKRGLKEKGYAVDVENNGNDALFQAQEVPYDLIVLDIMLPGKDGIFICRQLRKQNIDVPILMLTARDDVDDKVSGLDAGADDYLTKPFQSAEFLARVRALLRRKSGDKKTKLKVADLELDQLTHKVTRAGKEIGLTSTEYTLLEYLMLNANQIVTRTMISEHVWDDDFDSFSNVINVYVNYVRKKIDSCFEKKLIHSIRGTGYILKEE
ncbi:Phosphate regulon transcriptional regulatory protein PhoB (SphR) [hydrothermal vent metagenome]|uniref:Phosphate regulon transcriptional regulatory protein PhoB (SphR) n=1 Tax=hydrothermal vent metagenome TaxID=652676 RepID=A0A3B1E1D5_9ZZZZ